MNCYPLRRTNAVLAGPFFGFNHLRETNIMADAKSPSQTRLALAQFLYANDIDVETLFNALGADLAECDSEAVSHMAGIIDGITLATSKIRAHGIDNWSKN